MLLLKLLAVLCGVAVVTASYSQVVKSDHSAWHKDVSSIKHHVSTKIKSCGHDSSSKKWWSEWNHDFHSLCSEFNKGIDEWASCADKDGAFDLTVAKNKWTGWISALDKIGDRVDGCKRSVAKSVHSVSVWPFAGDKTPVSATAAHSKWSKAVHWEHSRVKSDISSLKHSVSKDISRCCSHAGSGTKKAWQSWKSHFKSLASAYSKANNEWQSNALKSHKAGDLSAADKLHSAWMQRLGSVAEFASQCKLQTFPTAKNACWWAPASAKLNLKAAKPLSARFQRLVKSAGK